MIARTWRGWVRTEDRDAYVAYIRDTGIAQYRATPGNLEAHLLTRDLDDGRTEVVTLSFWTSLDAVRAFAGDDVSAAVFYPEDGTAPGSVDSLPVRLRPRWKDQHRAQAVPAGVPA